MKKSNEIKQNRNFLMKTPVASGPKLFLFCVTRVLLLGRFVWLILCLFIDK